ncbi:MAG TPA: M28 family metallopeptidase [Terriglobales bacterium]|nr:M28 family metallopeptidase [Terriglobales bacterium]
MRTLALVAIVLVPTIIAFAERNHPLFDGKSWWAHVSVLASDKMEGRGTGTPGLERAAAYIVDQLKDDGLQPAGKKGFYQPISFRVRQLDETHSSLRLVNEGKTENIVLGEDAILSKSVDLAPHVDAPMVFAGYGLRMPELQYDDFSKLDAKGKIVVIFTGSPANASSALASHYQSIAERARIMREVGAIGWVSIPNPAAMDLPWSRIASSRAIPAMQIDDSALDQTKNIQVVVNWNPSRADALFSGTGHTFSEIAALGKERKPMPHFSLKKSLIAESKLIRTKVGSSNVAAIYPGSDARLKKEYVVLSAHMDHLGIGAPIDGDNIYNGAMDNASGVAVLLDIAHSLRGSRLKRSVLFVFVTAEEKGLLGSRYFASYPTVPVHAMVANINTDMFLPIVPLKSVIVYGLNESTLGDTAKQVGGQEGIAVLDDPEPLRNLFIRSDQYSFIKRGIPALAMKVGYEKGSPEEAKAEEWLHLHYHAPSDDLKQPVDLASAAQFEDMERALTVDIANSEARPQWKADSFFRRFASTKSQARH